MFNVSKYDAARDWLLFLIDHPDKSVSVSDYRAQLIAAQKAVASARKSELAFRG